MKFHQQVLYYMNILSLDVVLGAMAGMVFFAEVVQEDIPLPAYLILGMAVWSIYTFDHLMDGRTAKENKSLSQRHQFHKKYFSFLLPVVSIVVVTGLVLLLILPELRFIRIPGILLGVVMVGWMALLKSNKAKLAWLKEISIAVFYVLGIALVPFLAATDTLPVVFFRYLFIYFIIAFINILILSFFDEKMDKRSGFTSILLFLSKGPLKLLILILGLIGLLLLFYHVFALPSYFHVHTLILLLILLLHLILFFKRKKEKQVTRQSLEASFLLPYVLLLF